MDCSGICCIQGTTPTPTVTDVAVCNAGVGAIFVGTTGLIFVRRTVTNPCSANDWILLEASNPIHGRMFSNTPSSLITANVNTTVPIANPAQASFGVTVVSNGLQIVHPGIYRVDGFVAFLNPSSVANHQTLNLARNGVAQQGGYHQMPAIASTWNSMYASMLISLAVGDVLRMIFTHRNPPGVTLTGMRLSAEMI